MRVLAAIEGPDVVRKILECLDLPARAPPLLPAPSAPAGNEAEFSGEAPDLAFDQTPSDGDGIG
jgi:hypothetical protein